MPLHCTGLEGHLKLPCSFLKVSRSLTDSLQKNAFGQNVFVTNEPPRGQQQDYKITTIYVNVLSKSNPLEECYSLVHHNLIIDSS